MRRAKIVCTLGPATSSPEQVQALVDAGMDVARINRSHGTPEEHEAMIERVRRASQTSGRAVAILVDLQGPKIRLETFAGTSRLVIFSLSPSRTSPEPKNASAQHSRVYPVTAVPVTDCLLMTEMSLFASWRSLTLTL